MSRFKFMFLCIFILCSVHIEASIDAQTNTDDRILCPTPILPTTETIPPDFQYITYLYPSFGDETNFSEATVVQLSIDGLEELDTPFASDTPFTRRRLSPDSRIMAYLPLLRSEDNELVVWDMVTDEVDSLEFTAEELAYVNGYELTYPQRDRTRFAWIDEQTLVLRFYRETLNFGLEREQFFTVTTDPLRVERAATVDYPVPDLGFTSESTYRGSFPSPDGRYIAIFTLFDIPETLASHRFTVYDTVAQSVVIDVIPSGEFEVYPQTPQWYGEHIYVRAGSERKYDLTRISLIDGTIDTSIHDRAQAFFQNDITFRGIAPFIQDHYLVAQTGGTPIGDFPQTSYYLVYDVLADEASLYCFDNDVFSGDSFFPIVTPNLEYVGEVDNDELYLIDTQTGEAYKLPFHNFAEFSGWGHPSYDAQSAPD